MKPQTKIHLFFKKNSDSFPAFLRTLFFLLCIFPSISLAQNSANSSLSAYQSALIAYKTRDFEKASSFAQKAQQADPQDSKPTILLGKIALAQKSYESAEKILKPLLEKDPQQPFLLIPWGDVQFFLGKPDLAQSYYEKALLIESQKPDALLRLVYTHLKNQRIGEAERMATQLDGFNDKTPTYYFAKAAVLEANNKKTEAEAVLKNARTLYGDLIYVDFYREFLQFLTFTKKS